MEPGCFLGGLLRGSDQSETGHTAPVIPELRAWKRAGEGWRPAQGAESLGAGWGEGGWSLLAWDSRTKLCEGQAWAPWVEEGKDSG